MPHHLYRLRFPNGKIYLGIAAKVALRLAQHRRRKSTPEWRKSLSEAATRRWARDGKAVMTENQSAALASGREKRAKIGQSTETKSKISAALTGRKIGPRYVRTEATKEKQRLAMTGRKPNAAQAAALEAGRAVRWQKASEHPSS